MFDPKQLQSDNEPHHEAKPSQRSWVRRARAPFWMLTILVLILGGLLLYGMAHDVFRDRYAPPTLPGDRSALIPSPLPATHTPTPQRVAVVPTVSWTTLMILQTDGTYAPPAEIGQQIEAGWRGAMDSLNLLPWEATQDLTLYFSDIALQNGQLLRQGKASGAQKTIVGDRRFLVEGCNQVGTACLVSEAQNQISIDTYDATSHKKISSKPLDANLVYILSGSMQWLDGRWKVTNLNPPDVTTLDELKNLP